jgi:hypothetical protein
MESSRLRASMLAEVVRPEGSEAGETFQPKALSLPTAGNLHQKRCPLSAEGPLGPEGEYPSQGAVLHYPGHTALLPVTAEICNHPDIITS